MVQSQRTPFSAVDSAWIRMDRKNNPSIVTALLVFSGAMSHKETLLVLHERLAHFERFARVARKIAGRWYWEEPQDFSVENHLVTHTPNTPLTRQRLSDEIQILAGQELDYTRPLWLIHQYPMDHNRTALVVRVHHCIADGVALNRVLEKLSDTPAITNGSNGSNGNGGNQASRTLAGRVCEGVLTALRMSSPLRRLAVLPSDGNTAFKAPLTGERRIAWLGDFELGEIKRIGAPFGGTVNDVLLAILSGAMRRYLRTIDAAIPSRDIRAALPVNLRADSNGKLGNRFGLVFVDLPTSTANWSLRCTRVKQRMDRLKSSGEAVLLLAMLFAFGTLPEALQERALTLLSSKVSLVVSNLPGPVDPIFWMGHRLEDLVFWTPPSGHTGVSISFSCYRDIITCSVGGDVSMLPNPEKLTECFQQEFQNLRHHSQRHVFDGLCT